MTDRTPNERVIIYAEDDADDIEIMLSAIENVPEKLRVKVVENGKEVINYLQQTVTSGSLAETCVIMMDMNMPLMDGRQTVVNLKSNEQFKNLPVVLLSSAINQKDQLFAEKWGVNYFLKPDTIEGVNKISAFIIRLCKEFEKT